jgi:glyoxylase-like metal-dependent hydrolase (beta-lactamase superfamily II)
VGQFSQGDLDIPFATFLCCDRSQVPAPVFSLCDGSADYSLKNFFANVPIEQVEEALRRHNMPLEYVTTPYTYLYVDTGAHRLLVDMGAGNLTPRTGNLVQNMRAAGIDPAEIDTVAITHAHPDHIGGTLDEQGQPVFANARYFISKDEWAFWFSERAETKTPAYFVACARTNLDPLCERMTLLEEEGPILPGVGVLFCPGHTPGHMAVSFSSGGERLLYIGDTVLSPLHLEHPDWLPIYDILPDKAESSKQRIFDLAAKEQCWVMGQHFTPFPSLGHVVKQGKGWEWQPLAQT